MTEIIAEAGSFYDYDSKYADGGSRHVIPAGVHPDTYARALDDGAGGASRARLPRRDAARISATTTPRASPAGWCCWR